MPRVYTQGRSYSDHYRSEKPSLEHANFCFGYRRPALAAAVERDYQLVWYDRGGKQVGAVDASMKVFVGQDPRSRRTVNVSWSSATIICG